MAPQAQNPETGDDSQSLYYSKFLSTLTQRDSIVDPPAIHSAHAIAFPARSFTHLGVWAYLAFAFMLLAVTTVAAYLVYSCYHSAKGRPSSRESKATGSAGAGVIDRDVKWVDIAAKATRTGGMHAIGMSRSGDKDSGLSEKIKIGGTRASQNVVEMKGFNVSFGHERKESESKRKMIQMSHPDTSETSLNANENSFELEYPCVSAPPLAHTSERAAMYIPFHLPPPPPSPTPAHKQHVERYRGRAQRSPVSPSPSYLPETSPLPIAPRHIPHAIPIYPTNQGKSKSAGKAERKEPAVEFDSNNIRFVAPLNPFMTQSTVMLWNDPKLSPIHGSLIAPSSPTGYTSPSKFASHSGAAASPAVQAASTTKMPAPQRMFVSPPPEPRARSRGIPKSEKENINPNGRPTFAAKHEWESTMAAALPMKPSPGSF